MDHNLRQSYGIKDLGYCTIVGGGYLGKDGDVVVDCITNPKIIVGIAAGDGTLKETETPEDIKKIDKLRKRIT